MQPSIVVLSGDCAGTVMALPAGEFVIGREETIQLSLPDPLVALRHCQIRCDGDEYRLQEWGSLNRTTVNGKSITGEHSLHHGDRIRVGDTQLIFISSSDGDTASVVYDEDPIGSSEFTVLPQTTELRRRLTEGADVFRNTSGRTEIREYLLSLLLDVTKAATAVAVLIDDELFTCRRGNATAPVTINRAIVDRALKEGLPVLWNRATKSVICVPLEAFGKRRGAIYIDASDGESRLDYTHLFVFIGIASVTAVGYEAALLREELRDMRGKYEEAIDVRHDLIGDSPVMMQLEQFIARVAKADSSVLIQGESGTGKELVAHAIHRNSKRAERSMVAINCAAVPENLIESELFGYEKGAFTGAVTRQEGLIVAAAGGTLFLDEIGEMPLTTQAKLLRVLEAREVKPIGATKPIPVDFRLIAATNRDLKEEAEKNLFRLDLFYRLNVVSVKTPPLREHPEDIAALTRYFMAQYSKKNDRIVNHISSEALTLLKDHSWPGNVRELKNVIERAVVLGSGDTIVPEDLPSELGVDDSVRDGLRGHADKTSREFVEKILIQADGDYREAARLADCHPNSMHRLIKRHHLTHLMKNRRRPRRKKAAGA
jgi:two-component system, NtrC family, response regulator HydG